MWLYHLKLRFWKLKNKEKFRKLYAEKYSNTKCIWCDTWDSDLYGTGKEHKSILVNDSNAEYNIICGQCGGVSKFLYDHIIPICVTNKILYNKDGSKKQFEPIIYKDPDDCSNTTTINWFKHEEKEIISIDRKIFGKFDRSIIRNGCTFAHKLNDKYGIFVIYDLNWSYQSEIFVAKAKFLGYDHDYPELMIQTDKINKIPSQKG